MDNPRRVAHTTLMVRRSADPASLPEMAARLALTRRALGHTQAMMAQLMGSTTAGQAWENYESGRRRISIGHALALCRTCSLTLDWIYQGQLHTLASPVRDRIEELIRARHTTLKSRSG